MTEQRFLAEVKAARQTLATADHMLQVTFPLVKDTKLLLAIIQNMHASMLHALAGFLHYERFFRRIPPFHATQESMVNTFTMRSIPTHNLDNTYIELLHQLDGVLEAHKNAAIEFSREGKLVMATEKYNLKTIDVDMMKRLMKQVKAAIKSLLDKIEEDV